MYNFFLFSPTLTPQTTPPPHTKIYKIHRLAAKLQEENNIFSEGLTETGDVCVRVGADGGEITEERVEGLLLMLLLFFV